LTKDHVLASHNGGEGVVFNIIPACQRCNSSKGKKNVWEWFRNQIFYNYYSEVRIRQYLYTKYYEEEEKKYKEKS